jgi:hypothetical protein
MHNKPNKFIFLFIGIMIGFFLGSGIVWYKLTNNINDLFSLYKGLLFEKNKQEIKTIVSKSVNEEINSEKKYKNTYIPDSLLRNSDDEDNQISDRDSLTSAKTQAENNSSDGNIVVAKDEMIALKKYPIENLKTGIQHNKNLDSLLTDDKTPKSKKNDNSVTVEFWKSPINYKGYRYDNYKLIVFGLNDYDVTRFKHYENSLYLKCRNDYYQIEPTEKFRALSIVSNSELIKNLNGK